MRVLQTSDDLDLVQEPVSSECGRQLRLKNLESYLAMVLQVLCEENDSHSATPDLAFDGVAVGKCCFETFQ
jgi:hypothetical protein